MSAPQPTPTPTPAETPAQRTARCRAALVAAFAQVDAAGALQWDYDVYMTALGALDCAYGKAACKRLRTDTAYMAGYNAELKRGGVGIVPGTRVEVDNGRVFVVGTE